MGNSQSGQTFNEQLLGTKTPGFSSIYRKRGIKKLIEAPCPAVTTMKQLIDNTLREYGQKRGVGQVVVEKVKDINGHHTDMRKVKEYTYRQIHEASFYLGRVLEKKKLYFEESVYNMKLIGIYAKNRYEWFITDWACIHFGYTSVPLYDTLGIENLSYCLNQTEMTTLFVSAATIKQILGLKDIGKLRTLISYDKITYQIKQQVEALNLQVLDFHEMLQEGLNYQDIDNDHIKTKPQDCFTFSYTSGTTGPPKGVMISHKNLLSFIASINNHKDMKAFIDDIYISYLPLPHLMQRSISLDMFYKGTFVVASSGDTQKLKDDCLVVKPTIFVSVPRIYNRIVEAVKNKFAHEVGIKKWLVDKAIAAKLKTAHQKGTYTHKLYDPAIFQKVRASFGGNIRFMATGSAPTSPEVHSFMKSIMCCPLIEAYGQTEGSVAILFSRAFDTDYGALSQITQGSQIKLCDIPQMNYTSQDRDAKGNSCPRGQIWIRGPQVFMGYYKMPEATKEAITSDGWLRTGDIGEINSKTLSFRIIDRKKNIFKLQQGEYVAPEKVENKYLQCEYITEIFLHGDSNQNYAVAIAGPNKDLFLKIAEEKGMTGTYEQLCQNKQMRIFILNELWAVGKKQGLYGFEQAKNIYLDPEGFLNKGILTNTQKLVRFSAKKCFKDIIARLYDQGELVQANKI